MAPRQRLLDRYSGRHAVWRAAAKLIAVLAVAQPALSAAAINPVALRSPNAVEKAQTSLLDRMVTSRLSSVDVENFPSHESCRVQVHYRVYDVRHFAHSAHRMQRGQELMGLERMHWGLDDSRRDCIHAHTIFGALYRE